MRKLDSTTVIGLICGIVAIVTALFLGGNLSLFWNPLSVLITVVGSFSAVLINFGSEQIKNVFQVTKQAFFTQPLEPEELITLFGNLARKARREGLLALEDDIKNLDDSFYQKGVQMMVDAIEPEMIREVLEIEIECTSRRHELGQRFYRNWAALAPAFGMVGTLIGLIQMLARLEDPSALGPGMAVALVTTFYGAIMANLIFNPLAGKLALRSEQEIFWREMMLEAIIGIQSGVNPRILEERLRSFLAPSRRKAGEEKERAGVGHEERIGIRG